MAKAEVDYLSHLGPPAKRMRLDNESSTIGVPATMNHISDSHNAEEGSTEMALAREVAVPENRVTDATSPTQSVIPGLGRLGTGLTTIGLPAETLPQPVVAEGVRDVVAETVATTNLNSEISEMESTTTHAEKASQPLSAEDIEEDGLQPVITSAADETNSEIPGSDNTVAIPVSQLPETMDVKVFEPGEAVVESNSVDHAPEREEPDDVGSQPITHALEALLGGLDLPSPKTAEFENEPVAHAPVMDDNPEWEVDSSPYESSSDSSSSNDSSEDDSDEDGDNAYKLLSPEEQARILMEGDGGSDDEGGATKMKGAGGQLRTKNEVPEEIIPKPDVVITAEMRIEELGVVETIVENIVLIKAKTSGEYRALESGSVLCLADRSVFGIISETLGRVQQPLYTVRFTNAREITEAGLLVGTKVFYSEQHAKFALTQALKAYKGSDASNLHDEEVGEEEIEFSDDEAEAEHKKRLKQKKLAKRGGRMQNEGHGRAGPHGHPVQQQQHHLHSDSGGLSYDDAEDDGPYKPLARPTGFADTVGRSEAPQEGDYMPVGYNRGRGDFRSRGRGDRGRSRGDRGRGRGGFSDRRDTSGYSQAPQARTQQSPVSSQNLSSYSPSTAYSQSTAATPNTNSFYSPPSREQYSPQQPMWPQFSQQSFNQQFQGFQSIQNGWPNMPPPAPPPLLSGAFINPAFFPGNQHDHSNQWQQGQQGGRGRGRSS